MKKYIINSNDAGQRVDKFIQKAAPKLPQSAMYKGIRTKNIKLNRKRCEISTRLSEGDVLELYLPDEFFGEENSEEKYAFLKAPKNISVIYEDENILLIDKKNGLVVHEDNDGTVDTLVNRMQHYLYAKGEYDPADENSFTPSLCNRLDRNTGGIVIAAKNAESLRILNQKIKYRVLKTDGKLSLVEVELLTGRTHQIRAHMAYIGCPLLGDGKYGSNKVNRSYGIKTQALYSYKLKFTFTTDGGILQYLNGREFTAPDVWFENMFLDK